MPNPFFRFKKFTVYHDRCAMKVGTDGVLLGAWANVADAGSALDVGTGTALISLMLAQRNPNLQIDAIDIDMDAIAQAQENVQQSPYIGQISCRHISLQELARETDKKYDLIVSNPPYFEKSLKSPDTIRTIARHSDSLYMEELLDASFAMLSDKGRISLIYPYDFKEKIMSYANDKWLFVARITNVYPTPGSLPKRILIELSKERTSTCESDIIIEMERHVYSNDFVGLLKDFYLKF